MQLLWCTECGDLVAPHPQTEEPRACLCRLYSIAENRAGKITIATSTDGRPAYIVDINLPFDTMTPPSPEETARITFRRAMGARE